MRRESLFFSDLQRHSKDFLKRFSEALPTYKWSRDPFNHWSRQFEYPYVAQQIDQIIQSLGTAPVRILDAGSGITFFPYYLAEKYPNASVLCCDVDDSLLYIFKVVNGSAPSRPVQFDIQDLANMTYGDGEFDVVYSISVLEHLENPARAINEAARIIRAQGFFILTFDVSTNDKTGITFSKGSVLIENLLNYFEPLTPIYLSSEFSPARLTDGVTTDFIRSFDPSLLPWRRTISHEIKRFIRSRILHNDWRDLTFCCLAFRRL